MRIINVLFYSINNWGKIVFKYVSNFTMLVIVLSPWDRALSTVDMTFFIVTIDLMPFHVSFELFRLDLKYCFFASFVCFFFRVDINFPWFLYFKWSSALIVGSFFLKRSDRNLFFTEIEFCKPGVNQGFELNLDLYLLIF